MNVLREIRKLKKKSLRTRIWIILILLIMLVSSIYAWSVMKVSASINGLEGVVNSWDIEFYVDDEQILEDSIIFTVDEFYPGMSDNKQIVSVHNLGSTRPANVKLELISVKLFGEEILDELENTGNISKTDNSFTLFSSEKNYPFDVYIKYKNHLEPRDDDNIEASIGNIESFFSWKYSNGNDDLDTEYGKKAYEFYKDNTSDAIEVKLKITAGDIDI